MPQVPRKLLWWAGALVLVSLALVGWLSVTRGTPVRSVIAIDRSGAPPAVSDSTFAHSMSLMTGAVLQGGNRVEILADGDGTYPRLWDVIANTRETLTVQWYYSQPGALADTFAVRVAARARAGVRVLVLMDAFGSQNLPEAWGDTLRAAGVRLAWLRPLHWWSLHKANFRSHARVLVADGTVGMTGGYGLADYWLGDGDGEDEWRETNVLVDGPVVMQMQAAFSAAWAEATGELLTGDRFFPSAAAVPRGDVVAGHLFAVPTTGSTNGERFMALTIASARRRLWIANAYFVPDDDFRQLLMDAARRGVDVRVLTAGDRGDVRTTLWAGRARYEELLEAGVKIYEYAPSMMHAKTLVVDGEWSTVGSLNFDNRSLAFNNETNILMLDAGLGARMEAMYERDLTRSEQIELAEHRQRPLRARLLETGANLISRLL